MNRKDLFFTMYCFMWILIGMGMYVINISFGLMSNGMMMLVYQLSLVFVTGIMVLAAPVRRWVSRNIIDRLP